MTELYHTGYYLEPFWAIKERLESVSYEEVMGRKTPDDEEFIYDNAEIFLNGSCQLFSYALRNLGMHLIKSRTEIMSIIFAKRLTRKNGYMLMSGA